jgi:hypothetical protein
VYRNEEDKIKYFSHSPLAKDDHPIRKIITATSAGQEVAAT